jgi:TonB family protein
MFPGIYRPFSVALCVISVLILLGPATAMRALAQYVPASNLDPAASTIRLDSSFQDDAWLVYTYEIDAQGAVVNAQVRRSNKVPALEQALLEQVRAMRFAPATRNGEAVTSQANPVVYTWILDKPRQLGPQFSELYRQAWDHFSAQDYSAAQTVAAQLADYPGRNALEEVKSRLLSASLAHRLNEAAAELRHLQRVVDFQRLALDNNFKNVYVPPEQFLKILDRILSLQLEANSLGDAGITLDTMQALARGEPLVESASSRYVITEQALQRAGEFAIEGELIPLYPEGPAAWKTALSQREFYIDDVRGRVGSVYLACSGGERLLTWPSKEHWRVPAGWSDCKVDVSGTAGTRLLLHQVVPR